MTESGIRTQRIAVARVLALIGFGGPVLYVALTIALGLAWDGYDPIRQTQSELGAVDAPHAVVMNLAGFMGLGVTTLAFGFACVTLLRRSGMRTVAFGFLMFAGSGMVAVGFFPCDAGCVDVTRTGELHSVLSAPGAIGLPAAAMVSSRAFWADGRFSTKWQVVSFWLGLLALVSGPVIALDVWERGAGLLQRTAMWVPLGWMAAVSLRLRSLDDQGLSAA